MRKIIFILSLLSASVLNGQISLNLLNQLNSSPVFGCTPLGGKIMAWDTINFSLAYEATPFMNNYTITGITGLTTHPCTGEIYGAVKVLNNSTRLLAKYNPYTAEFSYIGDMGDRFSSITFREDGQLMAVTGDGGTLPETLFLMDHTTAQTTFATSFGNGLDGEIIAYNKDDSLLYHWSGLSPIYYEKLTAYAPYGPIDSIPHNISYEVIGAVYIGNNQFIISNINSEFRLLNTNGQESGPLGSGTPEDIRGLALVNRWVGLNGPDSICAGDSTQLVAFSGQAFQWTKNGIPIPNANQNYFYATSNGYYNCIITYDTLQCNTSLTDTAMYGKNIHYTGECDSSSTSIINISSYSKQLTIFPNPVESFISIKSDPYFLGKEFIILNAFGQIVFQGIYHYQNQLFDLSILATGVYTIQFNPQQIFKLIKL
jgi:hypothetical protein